MSQVKTELKFYISIDWAEVLSKTKKKTECFAATQVPSRAYPSESSCNRMNANIIQD